MLFSLFKKSKETPVSIIAIQHKIDSEDFECDNIVVELVIDDSVLDSFEFGPVDLSELDRSIRSSGRYMIWTCECGFPECAGRSEGDPR